MVVGLATPIQSSGILVPADCDISCSTVPVWFRLSEFLGHVTSHWTLRKPRLFVFAEHNSRGRANSIEFFLQLVEWHKPFA